MRLMHKDAEADLHIPLHACPCLQEHVDQTEYSRHAAAEAKQKLLHLHLLQEQVALELRKQ